MNYNNKKYKGYFMKKIVIISVFLIAGILLSIIINKIYNEFELNKFKSDLDNVFNISDEKNINLFDKIITVNKIFVKDLDINYINDEINNIVKILKLKIGNEGNSEIIMATINKFFFEEYGFKFDNNANDFLSGKYLINHVKLNDWVNLHSIDKILNEKKGVCLSLSIIYLIIAEKLNLSIYGILIPGHMFVRYETEGRTGINVETTYGGKEFYDYFAFSGIDILNKDKLLYGKKLNKKQVIAAYLNNIGIIFEIKKDFKKAKIIYDRILQILPDLPEVYNNLAYIYIKEQNFTKAEETLKKVIEIYPDNLIANTNLGLLYYSEKRFNIAEIYLRKSLNIYPYNSNVQKILNEIKNKR